MQSEIILLSITKDELNEIVSSAVESSLNKKSEKQLLTFKETCEFLGIHASTLNSWKAQKKIPFKKLGKRVFFSKKEVLDSLENFDHKKFNHLKQI
jgi:excisionase family DNA binding protein